ncbi:hypothetical protein OBBRIDRAFT_787501 [Obba rivulosa]|uniref:Uncharacterized protein n=1 Tax=Obba rivulosa TaxID=1052685 RepID=A0A8E2J6Z1_9APHY|nr:hypothetical protein OBBRIDRAFT_787501 [Obba rivulosa]
MSTTTPAPSATRGNITLQPSYFTSSLYVNPFREDIFNLILRFTESYATYPGQPFALFKRLWSEFGWCWLHFKVFDARARETFIKVTERLFLERVTGEYDSPIGRVVAFFALYTFWKTQPSSSNPSLHSVNYIEIPIDHYNFLLSLPSMLSEPSLKTLQSYVAYILSSLLNMNAFHILPHSNLRPYDPSVLPREVFIPDSDPTMLDGSPIANFMSDLPKKKGRPSKREKMRKAKDAVVTLSKYLDRCVTPAPLHPVPSTSGSIPYGSGSSTPAFEQPPVLHSLMKNPPTTSRTNYQALKGQLLDTLYADSQLGGAGQAALARANDAVLGRLKLIDSMAAERGLEVGGEGGEKTGLTRVEQAVKELSEGVQRGGILTLMEGAGMNEHAGMGAKVGNAAASLGGTAGAFGQSSGDALMPDAIYSTTAEGLMETP